MNIDISSFSIQINALSNSIFSLEMVTTLHSICILRLIIRKQCLKSLYWSKWDPKCIKFVVMIYAEYIM